MTGLGALLDRAATRHGQRLAIAAGSERLTWATLRGRVALRAGALRDAGLAGHAVVVQGDNRPQTVVDLLAVAWAGGMVVPVHPSWTGAWQHHAMEASGAAARLWGGSPDADAAAGALSLPTPRGPMVSPAPTHRVGLLTSGSTGRPKLVVHAGSSLAQAACAIAQTTALTPSDRTVALLPLTFHYGWSQLTSAMAVGAACVLVRSRLPAQILDVVAQHRATVLAAVPGTWAPLLAVQEAAPRDLTALRCMTNAGGRPDRALHEAFPRLLPQTRRVYFYGQTEVLRSAWVPPHRVHDEGRTLGEAFPGVTLAVVDDAGHPVRHGELGELVHGGAFLPLSVSGRAPQPVPAFGGRPGWRTGDLARRDADGRLWFAGRTDDVLKLGGFRVGPGPVEDALLACPGVTGTVVVRADLARRGPSLVAAVSGEALDLAALRRWCRGRLPAYMVPARIVLWSRPWPTTPNGKRDRRAVAAALAEATSKAP